MMTYDLVREDWDSIMDLNRFPGQPNKISDLPSKACTCMHAHTHVHTHTHTHNIGTPLIRTREHLDKHLLLNYLIHFAGESSVYTCVQQRAAQTPLCCGRFPLKEISRHDSRRPRRQSRYRTRIRLRTLARPYSENEEF